MNDPLGLVSSTQGVNRLQGAGTRPLAPPVAPEGPSFTDVLRQEIDRVDELQRDAKEAAEDFGTGARDDVESVMLATRKADLAFRSLMSVRNKVLEAYDELKQVRV